MRTEGRISQIKREAGQFMFGKWDEITGRWRMDGGTKKVKGDGVEMGRVWILNLGIGK